MPLTVEHCERCESTFESTMEHCPSCGRRSPHGWRNLLLKWFAVLIFLTALAFIGYAVIHTQGGK